MTEESKEQVDEKPGWVVIGSKVTIETGEIVKEIANEMNTTPSHFTAGLLDHAIYIFQLGQNSVMGLFSVGEVVLDSTDPTIQIILQQAFSGFCYSGQSL